MNRARLAMNNRRLCLRCPGCEGVHAVPLAPGDGEAWTWNGDLDRVTLSPSLVVEDRGAVCHSFVRDGRIEFLSDCTHALAGQTVALPPWED